MGVGEPSWLSWSIIRNTMAHGQVGLGAVVLTVIYNKRKVVSRNIINEETLNKRKGHFEF